MRARKLSVVSRMVVVASSLTMACVGGDPGDPSETETSAAGIEGCQVIRWIGEPGYMPGPNCSYPTAYHPHRVSYVCRTQDGDTCHSELSEWWELYWEGGCGQENTEVSTGSYSWIGSC